jgi:glycosyltransferase involved in cell wall biosynthesis
VSLEKHNPHRGLDPLVRAIDAGDQSLLSVVYAWRFAQFRIGRLPVVGRLIEYIELWWAIIGHRHSRHILLREFSTYYVWLPVLLAFFLRRKLVLLVAHNVQSADGNRLEKASLRLLHKIGVHFAVLEADDGLVQVLGIKNGMVLSHPVPEPRNSIVKSDLDVRVAMVGDMRPEKGLDSYIESLIDIISTRDGVEFCIGTNRVAYVSEKWPGCSVYDTSSYDSYCSFLATVDLLVIPYPESTYKYRASGIVGEAQAAGCAIITSDLPVLRSQVQSPEMSGVCLKNGKVDVPELANALSDAIAALESLKAGAYENAVARQAGAIYASLISKLSVVVS